MIPEFEVGGTPFRRGAQIGRRFRAEIQETLARLSANSGVRNRQVALVEAMRGHLEAEFPEIVEEIRGNRSGSGRYGRRRVFSRAPTTPSDRRWRTTSGAAAWPSPPATWGPILGKTDDGSFRPDSDRLGGLTILKIRPEEGYDVLSVNQIGTVWTECGVNAKGLCMGTNSGASHDERAGRVRRSPAHRATPCIAAMRERKRGRRSAQTDDAHGQGHQYRAGRCGGQCRRPRRTRAR